MSTQEQQNCEECKKNVNADNWCSNCHTFLCQKHTKEHLSNICTHQVITVEDYQNLPNSIRSMKTICKLHGKEYELYCRIHSKPCCINCFKDFHRTCEEEMPSVTEVTRYVKSSQAFINVKEDLRFIHENVQNTRKIVTDSICSVDEQKHKLLTEVEKMRKSVNEHLDKVEQGLRNSISSQTETSQTTSKKTLQNLEEKFMIFQKMYEDVQKVEQYGSDFQIFMSVIAASSEMKANIEDLEKAGQYNTFTIEMTPKRRPFTAMMRNDVIRDFESMEVCIHKSSLTTKLSRKCETIKKIMHIKPPEEGETRIRGCEIMSNGTLVFTDEPNRRLMLRRKEDRNNQIIPLGGKPYGVCQLDDAIVCITLPDEKKVLFVDVNNKRIQKSVKLGHHCFGIALCNKQIAVCIHHKFANYCELLLLNVDGKEIKKVPIQDQHVRNISFGDKTFKGTSSDHAHVFYNLQDGKAQLEFKDKNILRKPAGIAEDLLGNTYVAGQGSKNVVFISADGKSCREVFTEKDGVKDPFALCINPKRNEMLFCDISGNAFLCGLGISQF